MDRASTLRHGVKKILQHYAVGIWLDDFPVAWTNVHGQTVQQLQADVLHAGYKDYTTLLQDCQGFCHITVQPEMPHRPIVRFADPVPKIEAIAQRFRADGHKRFGYVCAPDLITEICHHFKVATFGHFCANIADIPTLKQLTELETKVYSYTSAFIGTREVITLYDLEQHLCQLLRVESYDRLQLGPLLRAPIIVQHFNPPSSLLKVPKIMYSNVVEAVKHLVTPKNPQVQPHAVLQWLTREFDVEMPQDLCVKVDSTEGIVQLVNEIQREEELIAKAIKQKKVKESQQEADIMQAASHQADVNLEALRQLNANVVGQGPTSRPISLDPQRSVWTEAPSFIKPRSFLQHTKDPPLENAPLRILWTAMHKRHDSTCEKLLDACRHKPVVFSLKMLAEAFGNTSTRELRVQNSKKLHMKWKQFWVEDVLAGLLLRAQAEHMYEPSTRDRLPETLTVPLTEQASSLCAGMLHLSPSEVTFGALYVHFLAYMQSFVRSYPDYRVNVCELGMHLAGFFNPMLSQEAVGLRPTQQAAFVDFWSNDALAAYLLSSLVKLLGGEPVYPETADVQEQSPDTNASNALGSPTKRLRSPATAATPLAAGLSPASRKGGAIMLEPDADAESAPPHDTHWLLGSAPDALRKLAHSLQACQHMHGPQALAAVELAAADIRYKDEQTWQFLQRFTALPLEASPWDAMTTPDDADGDIQAIPKQAKAAGKDFKPVSAQQLHVAAAQLHVGSSPKQLADLELAIQGHFKAPSFAALGHGASLLQCCSDDPVMMQTISAVSPTVPLNKVLMVVQQAMEARTTNSHHPDSQARATKAVSACLTEHFRVTPAEALGHGSTEHLIALAQQQISPPTQSVVSAAALAADSSAASKGNSRYLSQASVLEDARKCLLKAPLLCELHEWTSWRLLFEAELGSLFDFVQQQGLIVAIETSDGVMVKAPQQATSEDYSSALSLRDAKAVVAVVMGIVAAHRGVQHAPIAMLASQTKSQLAAMDTNETTQHQLAASQGRSLPKAAAFVLDCLAQLPEAFQVAVGHLLLLQPFTEVAESAAFAEQSLLKAAIMPSQRLVLHRLGFQLGVTLWQDAWRRCMLPPPPCPPNPTPAAFVSPVSDGKQTAPQLNKLHPMLNHLLRDAIPSTAGDSVKQVPHDSSNTGVSPMQTDGTAASTKASSEAALEATGQDAQQCKAVINAIRREEFGMGVDMDAASSQLRHRQNERIGRALQRLSQELYSKDTHFVLELVQNADDNSYAPGVLPALEFILQETGVTVLNNEVGFTEGNIRALCDVGRTTKKQTVGYIGQKGIGFKSVFKITDAPQIHSRGFHVCFDLVQHSALGYVLPTWVEEDSATDIASISKLGSQSSATKVLLPFKQGSRKQAGTLRHRFDDVRPTLLLFLQRLQCIIVNDATADETSIMIRRPLGKGLVELRHGPRAEQSSRWLQVSHSFQPSVARLDVQLDHTTVSLAFKLEGEAPTQQQVYAFLPLRSYGLCFIIQADFIVPSSREAVDCDSAWNELLREQVPNLFLQALDSFKQLPVSDADQPMAWVNRWLQSIPLPREAQSFFAALPHSLAARLQQSQCIPTEANHWVYPREALVCQDPQVRALLADPRLPAIVSLQYAHSDLSVLQSSQHLRALLGIGEVAHGHLLDVVRQLHSSNSLAQMGFAWLAQLLLCVFDSLQQERPGVGTYGVQSHGGVATAAARAAAAELKTLLLLPLSDGSFATVANDQQQAMYFPLDMDDDEGNSGQDTRSGLSSKQRQLLVKCNLQLRLLDPAFLEAAGQDKKPALIRALEAVGLVHVTMLDMVSRHILPALPASDADSHISYLALIISSGLTAPEALNASLAAKIIDAIKAHGKVMTTHGIKQLGRDFLHLPVSLGNKIDLVKLFPQHKWLFPSKAYLSSDAGNSTAWRVLFRALGFTDFIQAPMVSRQLSPAQKAASHWADADLGPLDATGNHTFCDWSAAEFTAVVGSLQQHCKDRAALQIQCGHLAHQIDALWEDELTHCASVRLASQATVKSEEPSTSDTPPSSPPSSFLHALLSTAWLPSSLGAVQPPSALFYPDSHILSLLGEHVPYLACPVKDPSLLKALKVITEVTWRDVLRMLSTWAQQASFKTSLEQMSCIYTFLATAMQREPGAAASVCSAFAQSPLVWLPAKASLADINALAAATPLMRGEQREPGEITPQPPSTKGRRKSGRKVAFMTPGTQACRPRTDTPAPPAFTPYTLTPSWTAPATHTHSQGHFYAASGSTLRLWDSTDVLERIPAEKLPIRILSAVYTNDAVMQFFADGLVKNNPSHASPIRQFAGLDGKVDAAAAPMSTARQPSLSPQAQQPSPRQQQQSPAKSQAVMIAPTAVKAKPARAALGDYIDLISSDEEAEEAAAQQDHTPPAGTAPASIAMEVDDSQQAQMATASEPHSAQATSSGTLLNPQGVSLTSATHQDLQAASGLQSHADPATADAAQTAATAAEAAQTGRIQQASAIPASPPSPSASHPWEEPQPLIIAEPSSKEYCRALAAVAEPLPPQLHPMQLRQVLAILNRWSRMVADSALDEAELKELLQDVRAFPIAGQQWVSLADGLILNDEATLARLFEGAHGVALLHLPRHTDRGGSSSGYQELDPLLRALQVPCLSRAVQQSVVPVAGWSGSVELDPIIADCLLALQRFLLHHMPAVYQAVQDTVAPLLLNLRCVIVGSLEVVYRLPTASGITISQPQPRAAALQDSDLFVEVDKLDSYTHILPELTRLFAKGAVEPELAQFLVALTLTMLSRQDVEAFMQQRGCPPLPDHIPEWQTPHLAKPPPEEEEDQDLDEEAAEAKLQEARLAVREGLMPDSALVRTKRELSPSASQDPEEPNSKKLKVGAQGDSPQAGHYTPMMDPSSRRVDYLDLATPQSASRPFEAMHRPHQRAPSPTLDPRPQAPFFADDTVFPPPPQRLLHMQPAAALRPGNVGRQIAPFRGRQSKRPGVREHDREVYQELAAEAGIPPQHTVSSLQDLYDAMYPYMAAPWVLQDIGHKAPSAWRAIAALAVRAPQHLPTAVRDKARPKLDGPAPRIDPIDLNHQTGRWGEELVFSYLQWQLAAFTPRRGLVCDLLYECPSTGWQVEWINYKDETRKPFDIRLRDPLGDDIYVEVKASALRGKNIFNISLPEMKFAEAHGNNVHIYRVAGVGTETPSLTRLINPIQLSKMKLINLCVQM